MAALVCIAKTLADDDYPADTGLNALLESRNHVIPSHRDDRQIGNLRHSGKGGESLEAAYFIGLRVYRVDPSCITIPEHHLHSIVGAWSSLS